MCVTFSTLWCTERWGRNSWCSSAWTFLCHVSNVFIFLHIFLYLMFSVAVYTVKGARFSQTLVNRSAQVDVSDLSLTVLLPLFFNSSSGVNVTKLVHKMHFGIILIGKQRGCSYFSLITAQNNCIVCYLMYYCHRYNYMNMPSPVHICYTSNAPTLVNTVNQTSVYMKYLTTISCGIKYWGTDLNFCDTFILLRIIEGSLLSLVWRNFGGVKCKKWWK
jgi:hypothetical protein